jgi:HEAT repeat protein
MFRPLKAWRLLRRFEAVDDKLERNEIASQLTDVSGLRIRERLERVLEAHPNPETRAMAAWTLGYRRDEKAAPSLAAAFRDDASVDVRSHAAEALGHLLGYSEEAPQFTRILLAGLDDPSPEVRFWSCFALGTFRDESAVPELQRLIEDQADVDAWWTVGKEAQWAIAHIQGETEFERPRTSR